MTITRGKWPSTCPGFSVSAGKRVPLRCINRTPPTSQNSRNLLQAKGGATDRQIKKCFCIQSIPGALGLVTTGPSVMMCLGIPSPVVSPVSLAATPAKIAPP